MADDTDEYTHAIFAVPGALDIGLINTEHAANHHKALRGVAHRDRLFFTKNPSRRYRMRAPAPDEFPAEALNRDGTHCVIVQRLTSVSNLRAVVTIAPGQPTPADTDDTIEAFLNQLKKTTLRRFRARK